MNGIPKQVARVVCSASEKFVASVAPVRHYAEQTGQASLAGLLVMH